MHRSLTRFIAVMVLVFATATSSAALAAPIPWRGVDVTLHAEQSGSVMLVSGELPETASLPAEAQFSVPAGSDVQWIGEILGGDPAADPDITYTKTTADGADTYRFTLTKSRNAQIEVLTDALVFDGSLYTMSLAWTPSDDVPEVRLIVRVPAGAQVATSTPGGLLQPGDSEFSYFAKTFTDAKAGTQLDLAVGYTVPAATGEPAASSASGTQTVLLTVLIALAIAGVIALIVVVRRSSAPSPVEDVASSDVFDDTLVVEAAEGDIETEPEAVTRTGSPKRTVLTASVVGLLILAAVVIGAQTTKPTTDGGLISKTYSAGEPCEIANIALAVPGGADPQEAAEAMFAALGPLGGLNTATFDVESSSLSVGYCESKTTEAAIREVLAPTGFVAP